MPFCRPHPPPNVIYVGRQSHPCKLAAAVAQTGCGTHPKWLPEPQKPIAAVVFVFFRVLPGAR